PAGSSPMVIGIVEKARRTLLAGNRGGALIPMGLAAKLHPARPGEFRDTLGSRGGETYNAMVVKVSAPRDVQPIEDEVKKMGFGSFSVLDATRNLRRFFAILDVFLGIFGSLALAV